MSVNHSARPGGIIWLYYLLLFIFFNMKVYCLFSLESPPRGDSNNYTTKFHFIIIIKKKITPDYSKSAAMGFFPKDSRTSSKRPW